MCRNCLYAFWVLAVCALLPATAGQSSSEDEVAREIDRLVSQRWAEEKIKPAGPANDAEFLRRVFLHVTGGIPEEALAMAFIKSKDPEKKNTLIRQVVDLPEAAENWAEVWTSVLIGQQLRQPRVNRQAFMEWLQDAFKKNLPFDRLVRELITAEGVSDEVGAVNFAIKFERPEEAAAATSRIFLGVQIQCAQCHNHPYEKWKTEDFWSYAQFFTKTRRRRVRAPSKNGTTLKQRFAVYELKGIPARFQKMMKDVPGYQKAEPAFLDGTRPRLGRFTKFRPALADWMTDSKNPFFARATVNRYWHHFLGRGFVHPVDDFGTNNPPSHPRALSLLAEDFVHHGYDLKRLCRIIMKTRVYQLSSRVPYQHRDEPPPDDLFAWQKLQPMTGEQILRSIMEATGMTGLTNPKIAEAIRRGGRLALRQFNFAFDTDDMREVNAFEGTIPQALLMMNGKLVNKTIEPFLNNTVARLAYDRKSSVDDRVRRLFVATLTRYPDARESYLFKRYLQEQRGSARAWSDLQWALLNTSEFMFVH